MPSDLFLGLRAFACDVNSSCLESSSLWSSQEGLLIIQVSAHVIPSERFCMTTLSKVDIPPHRTSVSPYSFIYYYLKYCILGFVYACLFVPVSFEQCKCHEKRSYGFCSLVPRVVTATEQVLNKHMLNAWISKWMIEIYIICSKIQAWSML